MSWRPNKIQLDDASSNKKVDVNRAYNQARDDAVKNLSITLLDVDKIIFEHFDSKLNLHVKENGESTVKVPILYGSPERWKTIQKDGLLRDRKGKLQIPLLVYKRTGMSHNDALKTFNTYLSEPFIKKYSPKNQYDRFSVITGMRPVKEVYNVTVPDQVIVTYECVVWTEYVEQNNFLVESISFSDNNYWGDDKRFKFLSTVDNYTTAIELPSDGDRIVRSTFTVSIRARLLPESYLGKPTTQKSLTKRKIVFNLEVETGINKVASEEMENIGGFSVNSMTNSGSGGIVVCGNSGTVTNPATFNDIVNFTAINKTVVGNWASSNDGTGNSIVRFANVHLLETPSILYGKITDKDKFSLYINGQFLKSHAYTIDTDGTDLILKINNTIAEFMIENDDEVIAIGKFA